MTHPTGHYPHRRLGVGQLAILRTLAMVGFVEQDEESGESVRIGTLHEGKVLVGQHVFRPDDSRQALEVGALLPAHPTAMDKGLLTTVGYKIRDEPATVDWVDDDDE